MAFLPYSYNDGQPRPFEYYKLSVAGSIEIGTAMALSGGKLAASATPAYICMRTEKSAAAEGKDSERAEKSEKADNAETEVTEKSDNAENGGTDKK